MEARICSLGINYIRRTIMFKFFYKTKETNTMIEVTRVYKLKGASALKTQKFTVAIDAIESIRPSNRLGHPDHRATITLSSGGTVDVADKYSAIRKMIGA